MLATLLPAVLAMVPERAEAQSRTLDWPSFVVDARLDSAGRLHVLEAQTIRFTGDWNGGERQFNVRSGQKFVFNTLRRIDSATGDTITLTKGELDEVDHYGFGDGWTLRWRSRLPDDPPFQDTEITYLLDYSYERIVQRTDSGLYLDHEFGFRDREGDIRNFALTLAVDDVWGTPDGFTGRFAQASLPAYESFLVNIPLTWLGAGAPAGVWLGTPAPLRQVLAGVFGAAFLLIIGRFFAVETRANRFAPMVPNERIDTPWLQEHVFSLLPEVAGAAWDDKIGPPEVSAALARMVGEGKLRSRVESSGWKRFPVHVLHLTLLVDRDSLRGYERVLVDKLFSAGTTHTDTEAIRKRYASSGFDPAFALQKPLRSLLDAHPDSGSKVKRAPLWRVPLGLALGAIVLLVLGGAARVEDTAVALVACALAAPLYLFGFSQAYVWRARVSHPLPHALRFFVPAFALAVLLLQLLTTGRFLLGPFTLGGLLLVALAYVTSIHNAARARYTPERMLFRKRLASARRYFADELDAKQPRLEDAWYPYLLAFGLGKQVDRWFRSFGPPASTVGTSTDGSSFSTLGSSSGSTSSGWGGFSGGGGFAGGGATVAFGAAVGAMSASVSPPSSSGSSSSGGGSSSSSGGSSGGGGGGGW